MISTAQALIQASATCRLSTRSLIVLACAMPLSLAACQVPGDGLKPPPKFSGQLPPEVEPPPYQAPSEGLASKTDSLADFLKFAGSDVVTFAPRSAELDQAARAILARQANWLAARPSIPIVIEGHSDERVSIPDAFALSEQRANAVRRFFIANGINGDRIRLAAFGKMVPRSAARNEAGWQENRRARTLPILEPVRETRP